VHWLFTLPRSGTRTVPVLLTGGKKLTESSDIVRFADERIPEEKSLFPAGSRREVEELVARYDEKLGVPVRRLAWCHITESPPLFEYLTTRLPPREGRWALRGERVMRGMMRSAFKVSPRARARMREKVLAELAVAAKRLQGRRYLVGDSFTAADLTFASLLSPVLMPGITEEEGRARDAAFADLIAEIRATPGGAHALRVIREHRP
jgi:glutathione S-transferase